MVWNHELVLILLVLPLWIEIADCNNKKLLRNVRTKRIGLNDDDNDGGGDKINVRTKRIGFVDDDGETSEEEFEKPTRIVRTKRIFLIEDDDDDTDSASETNKNEKNRNVTKTTTPPNPGGKVMREEGEKGILDSSSMSDPRTRTKRIEAKKEIKPVKLPTTTTTTTTKTTAETLTTEEQLTDRYSILPTIDDLHLQQVNEPANTDESKRDLDDNDIGNLQKSLYGFCRGQQLKQTFSAKGCENVTIETLVCGGVCQAPMQMFRDIEDIEKAFETCKYCGPLEYEEKLIFMQCHSEGSKRRRWKIEVRKMYVPKTCGCIQESCHKLNKVTGGGQKWAS